MAHVILRNRFMPHGMTKPRLWLAVVCLALVCFFASEPAHAYTFTSPPLGIGTSQICPGPGLVRRLVPCMQDTFFSATNNFLIPFSTFLASTVAAACTLAVILWGVKMLSGTETAPMKDALVMALKIGFVIMFTNNFGGFFGTVLDVMQQMLTVVCGYVIQVSTFGLGGDCTQFTSNPTLSDTAIYTAGNTVYGTYLVWDSIDCALDTLVGGIFSSFTLSWGIIGFLTACLFSNSLGFCIGMIGIYLIYKVVYAIIKCVYIYLSACMGVSFMVVISPLFIPTILFKSTKSYFDRWLKLFISFLMQPMVLFAYLAMLLAAFDTVIFTGNHSLYQSIAGTDPCFSAPMIVICGVDINGNPVYGSNGRLGYWLFEDGFYVTDYKVGEAVEINAKALQGAGLLPSNASTGGAEGKVADQMLGYLTTKQNGVMNTLLSSGGFFEISSKQTKVNWPRLAVVNGFDGSTQAKSTTSYILQILVSAFMALVTGYVFVTMLEAIPMIGSGMANDGKAGDSVVASLTGGKGLGVSGIASKFGLG